MPGYANSQSLNRYSYVTNNPLRYTDPSGHMQVEDEGSTQGCSDTKYCQNGKPKSADELKKLRNKNSSGKSNCAYEDYYACKQGEKRTPDYVTLNLGGSIPGLGTLISGQLAITLDRFGNFYLGPGLSIGPEAPLGFSASLSPGFINTWSNALDPTQPEEPAPGERRSEQILSGGYGNGIICIIFCGGLTNSLSNLSYVGFEVVGIGVPQASVGGGKSYLVADFTSHNDGVPIW